jgi:hypothetical protein
MTLPIVSMWLIFRLMTSIVIALGSHIRPSTLLEQTIPILPPSQPMAVWLERAFLTPWLRWDASWYLQIVEHGYQATDGTAQFHPLFPWAATILASIGIHPLLSLLVISSISGLGFLLIYYRLAKIDLPAHDSRFGIILMLLTPAAIVLFAPYAEALFLLCAASCLYLARIKRWWLAGLAGALAVLTRQQGLILLFPLAWELWEASDRSWDSIKKDWRSWLAISLIPAGYLTWIAYRLYALNDSALNLNSLHSTIFSIFISPSAIEVVPQQHFTWPWLALGLAIQKLIESPDLDLWVNISSAGFFLALLMVSWKELKPAYRLYVVLITLISFSYSTGIVHPYMGLPRHLLLAFPVFIYAAPKLNRPVWGPMIISLLSIAYLFTIVIYSLEALVP